MVHIPFSPPDISALEIEEVVEALRSGWITTGPRTRKFENMIASYCHTEKAVCLNSATAALELTLRILGIGPGDEVITTAYTYTASASVIDHVGAKIVLVDTAPDSFEMDYSCLEAAITERTKAIIPVDLGGVVADYEKIFAAVHNQQAKFHAATPIQEAMGRIAVVADAAHAFGACCGDKMCGEIADFTCFSFHAVKNLTTAEGGAVVWNSIPGISNQDIYNRYQLFSLHGQSKDALHKSKAGAWEYDILMPGYKCNMTDVTAAVGLKQLERYPAMLERRHWIIQQYDTAFHPLGIQTLKHSDNTYRSSGHLYLTRIPGITVEQRNEIILKMADRGIACNVHYKPLPMLTAYKNLGFAIEDYPNAYSQFVNEITLPLYTLLTDQDVECVIKNYKELLKEYL